MIHTAQLGKEPRIEEAPVSRAAEAKGKAMRQAIMP
jgi:hypothetical protein